MLPFYRLRPDLVEVQTRCSAWQSGHSAKGCVAANRFQWRRCSGVRLPVPRHNGHAFSKARRMAVRMNSDRFGIPRIASRRALSALNVMISCLGGGMGWSPKLQLPKTSLLLYITTKREKKVPPCPSAPAEKLNDAGPRSPLLTRAAVFPHHPRNSPLKKGVCGKFGVSLALPVPCAGFFNTGKVSGTLF